MFKKSIALLTFSISSLVFLSSNANSACIHPNGTVVNCSTCVAGNSCNCPTGTTLSKPKKRKDGGEGWGASCN